MHGKMAIAAAFLGLVLACGEDGSEDGQGGGVAGHGGDVTGGSGGSGGSGGVGGSGGLGGGGSGGSGGSGGGEGGSGGTGGSGGSGGGPIVHRAGLFDLGGITQLSLLVSGDVDHVDVRMRDAQGKGVPADLDLNGQTEDPSAVPQIFLELRDDGRRSGGVATSDATRAGAVSATLEPVSAGGARGAAVEVQLEALPRPGEGQACDPTFNFDLCQEGLFCQETGGAFRCAP